MTYYTSDPVSDAENYLHRMDHTCECGRYVPRKMTECADCDARVCSQCAADNSARANVSIPLCGDCREVYLVAAEKRQEWLALMRPMFRRVSRL